MNRRPLADWLMFVWLTVGYAVVHGVAALWLLGMFLAIFGATPLNEYVQVFEEDGPLIVSVGGGLRQATYRRLDGTVVTGAIGRNAETSASLDRGMPGEPPFWDKRVVQFIDFMTPTVNWYLIVPPGRTHAAYFVGYEQLSNRKVGYLGTEGFSSIQPPNQDGFDLAVSVDSAFTGNVAATQSDYLGEVYEPINSLTFDRERVTMTNAAVDAVWLLAQGTIYEIRLSTRTVRKLLENRPEIRFLTRITVKQHGRNSLQLLARTNEGLLLIDPESLMEQSIGLTSNASFGNETFYQLRNGQRFLVATEYSSDPNVPGRSRVFWIDESGRIERSEDVSLQQPTLNFDPGVGAALALPAPAASIAAALVGPLVSPRTASEPENYFGRVRYLISRLAVWHITSLVIGGLCVWACRRREREVFGNTSWLWPVVVGLCGWFGWMGYSFVRPLPARLPSGAWIPAQPEPNRPLGTEIFA